MELKLDRGLINLALVSMTLMPVAVANEPSAIAQTTNPSTRRPQLPMAIEHAEGTYTLTVPDTNTTRSAYGGQLRLYDAHIAVMFEVTYADCQEIPEAGQRSWFYFADNGRIDMGEFSITCQLAKDIALTYGLGKPEPMVVSYSQEEAGAPIAKTRLISPLNLTGDRVQRWMDFVQKFKPVNR